MYLPQIRTPFNYLLMNLIFSDTIIAGTFRAAAGVTVRASGADASLATTGTTAVDGVSFRAESGATLSIGGTNTFPSNYSTVTLGTTSTVNYSGTNQTVSNQSYGHLTLSGSGHRDLASRLADLAGRPPVGRPFFF